MEGGCKLTPSDAYVHTELSRRTRFFLSTIIKCCQSRAVTGFVVCAPPLGLQKLDSENSSQVIVPSCSILLILLKSVVGVRKSRTSTYWYGFIWYPFHVYWTGYWSVVIMFALRQCVVYVYMFHSDICRILLYRVSLSPSIPGSSVDLSILILGINTCH